MPHTDHFRIEELASPLIGGVWNGLGRLGNGAWLGLLCFRHLLSQRKHQLGVITDLRDPIKEKGFGAFLDHPDILKALRSLDATLVEARTLMVTGQTAVKGVDESMGRNLASLEKTQTIIRGLLENRGDDLDKILVNLSSALKQLDTLSAEARVLLKTEGGELDTTLKTLNRNLRSTEELVEFLKAKSNRLIWGKTTEKEKAAAQRNVDEARRGDTGK